MTVAGSPPDQALDGPSRHPAASAAPPGAPAAPARPTFDALERLRAQLTDTQHLLDDYLAQLQAPTTATGPRRG